MRSIILLLTLFTTSIFCENAVSKYAVNGMRCSVNCCNKVQEAFNGVEGVNKCDDNFDTKVATISYDNSKIDKKGIEKVLQNKTTFKYSEISENSENSEKKSFLQKIFSIF